MTPGRRAEIAVLVEAARTRMSPERCFALLTACAELLADASPRAEFECRTCAAVERHERVPSVRRLADRLRDELTVYEMLATAEASVKEGLGRLSDWRRRRVDTVPEWRRVLDSLSYGPLPLAILDEDIHGPPVTDRRETAQRQSSTRNVVRRLAIKGRIVRVGRGVYALPTRTEGMVARGPEDARRLLADTARAPAGLTLQEIADRCDVAVPTVEHWLTVFRRSGVRLVVTYGQNKRAGGHARYRIEPPPRPVMRPLSLPERRLAGTG